MGAVKSGNTTTKNNNHIISSISRIVTVLGLIAAVLGFLSPWLWNSSSLSSRLVEFLGLFIAFVSNAIPNLKTIKKLEAKNQALLENEKKRETAIDSAYDNGLLTTVIKKALEASSTTLDQGRAKKKIEHFLLEISQVDRLNPLKLQLDDPKYDNLYQTMGALSITDAPVFAWKNPEYNWFLLSNYSAVLLKRLGKIEKKQIKLVDRNNVSFRRFIIEGNQLLKKIKEGTFDYQNNVRFYLLTKEDIERNKAMIEQMVAGHDLFGIHLFIVNKDILSDNEIESFYTQLKNKALVSNNVIDLMIYKNNENKLHVKYPDSETGELKEKDYDEEVRLDCEPFLKKLASFIIGDNHGYLLYPRKAAVPFALNNKKTHLAIIDNK